MHEVAERRLVAPPWDSRLAGRQAPIHRQEPNELQGGIVARPSPDRVDLGGLVRPFERRDLR